MTTESRPSEMPRSRLQFGFGILAEVFVGLGLASALYTEMGGMGVLFALCAIGAALTAIVIGRSSNRRAGVAVGLALWAPVLLIEALVIPHALKTTRRAHLSDCFFNLEALAAALRTYHEVNGRFPPNSFRDEDGRAVHSWRAFVLPHLGEQHLFDYYDPSQPWDSQQNRSVAGGAAVALFPYRHSLEPPPPTIVAPTNYFMVVGPGRTNDAGELPTLEEIAKTDRLSDTILLVESDTLAADWFEPRDMTMDEALRGINASPGPSISSAHQRPYRRTRSYPGAHVAMADGSVRFLPAGLDHETLKALLTIGDRQPVDWSRIEPPDRPFAARWPAILTAMFLVFVIWRHAPRRTLRPLPTPDAPSTPAV